MKAKDIENEMRRIAEEGRGLQEKLAIIESLKDCHDNGYDWTVIEHDIHTDGGTYITIQCKKSGAVIVFGNPSTIRLPWRWVDGPFKGLTVEEVYEIEDTDPIPEPPLVKESKESTANYEMIREVDEQGVHRTKVVPKGSEKDDGEIKD